MVTREALGVAAEAVMTQEAAEAAVGLGAAEEAASVEAVAAGVDLEAAMAVEAMEAAASGSSLTIKSTLLAYPLI